ncbi:unnamed protein product [Linum tenue]|uniref:Core-2/I-branching beta-1,6-N-acetylglucosaminyltransferase family protein n=1 Tax=Linum tenue TaxID=586396 RepID=A0AAV0K2Q2_9ROSI|nr:unnamed protein product [Linum tenue]
MLTPTPFSLFCALLLCLPLAVVFTITTPTTTVSPAAGDDKPPSTLRTKLHSSTSRNPLPKDDSSLLRLAARVNPNPTPPPQKIAFLFLTTTPLPFAPLWELFFNPIGGNRFNIYIHADPTRAYDPPFTGVFAGRVIHSEPTNRHTPTLASAARRLLAHALLHDPANAVFALLSPSCIPLHSFDFTYQTLTRSGESFIEILANETGARDRWAARGEDAMLPEVRLEEDFRIGSQFWSLTRSHARMVVADRTIWRKFNRTCVREDTCYPEENYFPTLIHMRDPRGATSATLTHVDWRGCHGGHPRMYGADEVGPELINGLRNGRPRYGDEEGLMKTNGSDGSVLTARRDPFLFARKFSPAAVGPLMDIAAEAILKDE